MKTKYAVPTELVDQLIKKGICNNEEDAREKVASGEAPALLKEQRDRLKSENINQ